jgi:transposase
MKIPEKFVSPLNEEQIDDLNRVIKDSIKSQNRRRAQAILLSAKGYCIDEIAKLFDVNRNTVSIWINKWEQAGVSGLEDNPRSGHPCILTDEEKELVIKLASAHPRSVPTIIALLIKKTGKRVSDTTIKRILKAAKFTWKRIRKSLKNKRDNEEFNAALGSIQELRRQHEDGEIELWYFDETGFDLQPTVPYAWQPNGEIIEVSSERSKRLNVLGFFTPDNRLEPFCFECGVDTDVVIACFNAFIKTMKRGTKRVVVMDNASIHTSSKFIDCIPKWEKKGLIIKFLPTYSPELNIIEILWRFIKYYWLPFSAYLSFDDLVREVENILARIGTEFKIDFAS